VQPIGLSIKNCIPQAGIGHALRLKKQKAHRPGTADAPLRGRQLEGSLPVFS
jgi:hypothetical protein